MPEKEWVEEQEVYGQNKPQLENLILLLEWMGWSYDIVLLEDDALVLFVPDPNKSN
jgi:hypothetical protein